MTFNDKFIPKKINSGWHYMWNQIEWKTTIIYDGGIFIISTRSCYILSL
jgi:hypothetical protein